MPTVPRTLPVLIALLLLPACWRSTTSTPDDGLKPEVSATPANANGAGLEGVGEDITERVKKWHSDAYAKPPTSFRQGHATPRKLDPSAFKRDAGGFRVQLPSRAPVVTPAVHQGMVFTSGGFHSKEFYAFDAESGELVWGVNLDDDGPSAAACADGVCVINTESCTLFAFEARTGKLLWSWWLGDPLMSAPAIANGKVFSAYPVTGRHGGYGLNGNIAPNQLNGPVGNGPNSLPNAVPVPQQQAQGGGWLAEDAQRDTSNAAPSRPPGVTHALAAFDLRTGKILWQRWIDSDVMSAPVVAGEDLYATSFAGTVYKFHSDSGAIQAAYRARATSAPVVEGDEVFFTQRTDGEGEEVSEGLVATGRKGGQARYRAEQRRAKYLDQGVQSRSGYWTKGKSLDASNGFAGGAPAAANAGVALGNIGQSSVSTLQAFQGSRVLHYGGNNINSMGDEVVATRASDGKRLWSMKLDGDVAASGGFLAAPPVAVEGHVVLGTLKGEVHLLDPDSGRVKRTFKVGAPLRSQPVVEGGWIYVGTEDGQLIGIRTGDVTLTGWPMWGGSADRNGVRRGG